MSAAKDNTNLTQAIKGLTLPASDELDTIADDVGMALLISREKDALKWGQRWLTQAGLHAEIPSDSGKCVELARSLRPDVIIVDAGLCDDSGESLYRILADAADLAAPIIVLGPSNREMKELLDSGVYDVVRKPCDWQLVARRARFAWEATRTRARLRKSDESLSRAIEVADATRKRLRSTQAFEPVTGLPNKDKFMDLLTRGMAAAHRDGTDLAVFVIGFSRFRLIIEAMGQEQADRALTEFGGNLAACLHDAAAPSARQKGLRTAAVASLDQFRFGLMLTCMGGGEELSEFRNVLMSVLSRPVVVGGQTAYLSACAGAALYPQDADTPERLLQRADNAMRDAQSRGGGFRYFCAEMDAAAARKLEIEHKLHEALDQGGLALAYQPIADIETGRFVAAEALLRWPQEDGTFISPSEFIPVAEESDVILRTGEFVLDQACRQLAEWRRDGLPMPRMCVNVARAQLNSIGFTRLVEGVLARHGLEPAALELEISERGVLAGNTDAVSRLHELNKLGVRLSVDDFGTGDSAIAYLKELPVDVLKIDQSYVAGLGQNHKDAAIASAIAALGKELHLEIVAEGVETETQLAAVCRMGCTAFQGFLVSRAVAPDPFAALCRRQASP